jgi:putative DNA primase/helicase
MITLARKSPGVPISVTELDRNPWLLGVENGVVDLRTGELSESEAREEYVTNRCTVRYDASAIAPRWEQFIVEITGLPSGDPATFIPRPAMARYLHKALGYSITGATVEQKLFLAWGEGSNGKNGMFDAVKHLLGGYARVLPSEALMATARPADSERPTALAATLAGARFVLSSETKDGQTLDVGLIKNHTGDAEMTARRMRENPFTFTITHKLWISTNNKPNLSQVDAAIRGRLHLLPFERRWNRPSEIERDPTLPDGDKTLSAQLAAEHEGILAWLVRGAALYHAEGLDPPAEVTDFTRKYISGQDAFARWLETMQRCEAEHGTGAAALFNLFASWCVDEGMPAKPDNPTAFSAALKKYGIAKKTERAGAKYALRSGGN